MRTKPAGRLFSQQFSRLKFEMDTEWTWPPFLLWSFKDCRENLHLKTAVMKKNR